MEHEEFLACSYCITLNMECGSEVTYKLTAFATVAQKTNNNNNNNNHNNNNNNNHNNNHNNKA